MIHITEETIVQDVPKVINIIGTVYAQLLFVLKLLMTSPNLTFLHV